MGFFGEEQLLYLRFVFQANEVRAASTIRQRLFRKADLNAGFCATVSALAIIIWLPIAASLAHAGMSPT